MINYKELRIGNWIRKSKRNDGVWCNEEDLQVKNISEKGLNLWNADNPLIYEWQWFEPIPLTKEILEKCGISIEKVRINDEFHQSHYDYFRIDDIKFIFKNNSVMIDNINCEWVDSLHQLQNLHFTLTGEELEYTPCK